MDDSTHQLDCTAEEILTCEVGDEQLEAAADENKPLLWTYPTSSCGGGYPPYCG